MTAAPLHCYGRAARQGARRSDRVRSREEHFRTGSIGLLEPTKYISETGQRESVDGVSDGVSDTPGTELRPR